MLRRAARILRFAGVAAIALEALYLVVINVFLSTSLFEKAIDGTPEAVDIHFGRGWSVFPTRVHAQKLSIRGADSHLEWILRLDEVEFDCSLLALLHKEFRITMARGSGITFRARFKEPSPAATPELDRELPSIDSLGSLGFVPSEPPYAGEWDDKLWHLWTVNIRGADAEHVREVWIEHARFTGDAHIVGGFYLKPIRRAEVGPATVLVRAGRVALDSRVVADHLVASADLTLASFDPRGAGSVLRHVSLSTDASLEVPDLQDLGILGGDDQHVSGKVTVPRLALRITNGVLRDGTEATAEAPSVAVRSGTREVSGALDFRAEVERDQLAARIVARDIDTSLSVAVPLATISLDSGELELDKPFGDLHAVVDVPEALLRDASRLAAIMPAASPVRVKRGSLRGSAHAEGWRKGARVAGNVAVHGERLELAAGPLEVHGEATIDASVGSLQLDTLVATDARATIVLPEAALARGAAPTQRFIRVVGVRVHGDATELDLGQPQHSIATFEASAAHVDVEYAGRRLGLELRASARAHGVDAHRELISLDDARVVATHVQLAARGSSPGLTIERVTGTAESPVLRLSDPLADLRVTAAVDGAHLVDVSVLRDLLPPSTNVTLAGTAATLDAKLAARVTHRVIRGTASAHVHGLGVMSPKLHVAGDVEAAIDVARWDLAQQTLAGTARVSIAGVTGGFDPHAAAPDFVANLITLRASSSALDLGEPSMRGVGYDLELKEAELVDARALNTFLPSSEILAIESGRAYASLHAQGDGERGVGALEVRLSDAGLVLDETHFVGDFELAVRAAESSGDGGETFDLEGSHLAMTHVIVTGASTDTAGWAGDLMLETGTLSLGATPKLDADLTLRARDANPFLGILFRDTLSPLIASWTRMPTFTAVTHLVVEPQLLLVSDLIASGGNLTLRGTLALRPHGAGGSSGAFVLHKGPWSAGINLDDHGLSLRLFGLDGWYRDRSREITRAPQFQRVAGAP